MCIPTESSVYLAIARAGCGSPAKISVAAGGENSVAVFSIDVGLGGAAMAQAFDTRGYHPRTFSIDPGGKMLVVANLMAMPVRDGDSVRPQPATLSAFRIAAMGS